MLQQKIYGYPLFSAISILEKCSIKIWQLLKFQTNLQDYVEIVGVRFLTYQEINESFYQQHFIFYIIMDLLIFSIESAYSVPSLILNGNYNVRECKDRD